MATGKANVRGAKTNMGGGNVAADPAKMDMPESMTPTAFAGGWEWIAEASGGTSSRSRQDRCQPYRPARFPRAVSPTRLASCGAIFSASPARSHLRSLKLATSMITVKKRLQVQRRGLRIDRSRVHSQNEAVS